MITINGALQDYSTKEIVDALAEVALQWTKDCDDEIERIKKEINMGEDDELRPNVIAKRRRITVLYGMATAYERMAQLANETANYSVGIAPNGTPTFLKGAL